MRFIKRNLAVVVGTAVSYTLMFVVFALLWSWRNPSCPLGTYLAGQCSAKNTASLAASLYFIAAGAAGTLPSFLVLRWMRRRHTRNGD